VSEKQPREAKPRIAEIVEEEVVVVEVVKVVDGTELVVDVEVVEVGTEVVGLNELDVVVVVGTSVDELLELELELDVDVDVVGGGVELLLDELELLLLELDELDDELSDEEIDEDELELELTTAFKLLYIDKRLEPPHYQGVSSDVSRERI